MPEEAVRIEMLERDAPTQAYDAFLDRCGGATIYHSAVYRDLVLACIEAQPLYALAMRGDEIVGAMPAMATAGPYGRVVNSLPFFGSHGDVLATDPAAVPVLQEWFRRTMSSGVAAATVVGNPFDEDRPDLWPDATLTDERIAQWTELSAAPAFPDLLLETIDSSARRNIRKAASEGVQIAVENDAIAFLAETHAENMTAIGGKPKPDAFFHALGPIMKPDRHYRIYVARIGGKAVAALLVFYFKQFAEYITPVTLSGYREAQPTAAILFGAMCDAAREGRRIWNWGGTWLSQTGVYRFKRKWGARDGRYRYATYILDERVLEATAETLAASYPFTFVAPYSALRTPRTGDAP